MTPFDEQVSKIKDLKPITIMGRDQKPISPGDRVVGCTSNADLRWGVYVGTNSTTTKRYGGTYVINRVWIVKVLEDGTCSRNYLRFTKHSPVQLVKAG